MTAGRPRPDGMPWQTARAIAVEAATPLPAERIAVSAAAGRVLAEAARAARNLPDADTATVDGYAVTGGGPWRLTEGRPAPGEAARVATGATVPGAARAVIAYEAAMVDGNVVTGPLGPRAYIRRAGDDVRAGDVLAPAGRAVTPALAGLLVQGGVVEVAAHRRPRVLLLVAGGREVATSDPGATDTSGAGLDVFGPMVSPLVTASGGVMSGVRALRGGMQSLAGSLRETDAEIVAVSGSSSAGRRAELREAIRAAGGSLVVDRVACRPGNPQLLASLPGGRWLVGLPGNPYAGLVACLTLLQPLLRAFSGLPPIRMWGEVSAAPGGHRLGEGQVGTQVPRLPVHGDPQLPRGMTRLVPVLVRGFHAEVVAISRPASLAGAAMSDAVAVLGGDWEPGGAADLLPWGGLS